VPLGRGPPKSLINCAAASLGPPPVPWRPEGHRGWSGSRGTPKTAWQCHGRVCGIRRTEMYPLLKIAAACRIFKMHKRRMMPLSENFMMGLRLNPTNVVGTTAILMVMHARAEVVSEVHRRGAETAEGRGDLKGGTSRPPGGGVAGYPPTLGGCTKKFRCHNRNTRDETGYPNRRAVACAP